jgi:anti-sigma factor RsiW
MTTGPCQQFRHLLGAYVDGQLEPATVLGIDDHLDRCDDCRETVAFQQSLRGSLRREVRAERMPEDARARLIAALAAESARADADAAVPAETPAAVAARSSARGPARGFRPTASWGIRSAVPLTAAAALALLWGASARGPLVAQHATMMTSAVGSEGASKELLDELLHEHSQPLPPERTDPKDLRAFEQYVGVPVRARIFDRAAGTRLVGGRVLPVHQERAAMLQYEVGSGPDIKRVSVLIYDPRRIQVGNADELAPRTMGTAEVRVGRARGYSVAVTQHEGVGYALASDMDPEHSVEFVNAVAEVR